MARNLEPAPLTRMLASLGRVGTPGRILAPQLDALRAPGLVAGLQRWRPAQDDRAKRLARGQTDVYHRIWERAAATVGAELNELAAGFLTISLDGVQTVVWRHLVMLDHPATTRLSLDKSVVHQLLTGDGLPVPDHVEAGREDRASALAFLARSAEPCVVKPSKGTSDGDGVTCGVEYVDDLWRAWLAAARWDSRILVERQTAGEEYRLLLLDGELLGAVHRRRPTVVGDGSATVLELIEAENQRRLDSNGADVSRAISVDLDCELAVRRSSLSLRSVAPPGQVVTVKSTVGQNARAENSTVHNISPELVREGARAAALLQLRLAGIDLVTPNCAASLREAGGAILEVNATPGLHYHYQVADAEPAIPVAEPILRTLLNRPAG